MRRSGASVARLEAEDVVDEDRAVEIGLGEAVGARVELGMLGARLRGPADRGWPPDGRARDRRGSASWRAAESRAARFRSCGRAARTAAPSSIVAVRHGASPSSRAISTARSRGAQDAPRMSLSTTSLSSSRSAKNLRQDGSTDSGCSEVAGVEFGDERCVGTGQERSTDWCSCDRSLQGPRSGAGPSFCCCSNGSARARSPRTMTSHLRYNRSTAPSPSAWWSRGWRASPPRGCRRTSWPRSCPRRRPCRRR